MKEWDGYDKVCLSKEATKWMERVLQRVMAVAPSLREGGELAAAAAFDEIINDPIGKRFILSAAYGFEHGRSSISAPWRKEMEEADAEVRKILKQILSLSDRLSRLHHRVDEANDIPTFSELSAKSYDAINAAYELSVSVGQMEAAAGPNIGGRPSDPAVAARLTLEKELAREWIRSGRSLYRDSGKIFHALILALHEALTGSEEMPDSDDVLRRLRKVFTSP